jgi:isopentenyl-diphosphate delta-isomerase type 1
MSEEYFDVVNERDEVIGREARSQVHRLGLYHRAVHVLVFDPQHRLFLQKRSQWKDTFPGTWDSSASGHLAPGESYDACAVREAQEELGITFQKPPEKLFKIEACPATGREFIWVYRAHHAGPFILPPEEIESGDWFAPEVLEPWMSRRPGDFAPALPLIWGRLPPLPRPCPPRAAMRID